jgi:hypothetical protein
MLVPFALVSGDAAAQCTDRDGDGYGRPGDASCPAGPETDCNDRDADAYPGAFETCDGANTESTDAEAPPTAGAYYYLVRAENPCPEGEGELGWRSDGQERLGRECP